MQHRAGENGNHFQSVQRNAVQVSTSIETAGNSRRCRFVFFVLCGMASMVLPVIARAQSAPQTLPYYHTIAAGSGTTYSGATVPGSTTTIIHGTAPGDGGSATAAAVQLNGPDALATDSLGNLYIVDSSGTVRKVDNQGNISTFAGGISVGKSSAPTCLGATDVDGDGCPANEAFLNAAHGIAIDPASGDFYIAESTGNRIRKISHSTYIMTLVVGTGSKGSVNGDLATCSTTSGATCSGTPGSVSGPRGLAVDKHGNLYIADSTNSAVRLVNFSTGQLTTVVNLPFAKATTATCTTNATATTAGAASTGLIVDVAFDNADNLYVADATCNYVYKVAEDPATGMVDGGSAISVVLGSGLSSPAQSVFTNVPGTSVVITPGSVRVDPLGNLYVGENTGTHVWFWDVATKYMHTIFGGPAAPGNCYGVPSSGTPPYNGCDGQDSAPTTVKGTLGLALDAWGNLYIADVANFYVHKLALGTNGPAATVPAGNGNTLMHFGAGDGFGSISLTGAPDFSFAEQSCTVNSAADNTQDCGFIVTNTNPSTSAAQYEQAVVTSTAGKTAVVPLTNQAYPTCQPPTAANKTVVVNGTASVTLTFTPGEACTGFESIDDSPHAYSYSYSQPANATGVVSGTGAALTFAPNGGTLTVSDSFTYTVTDANTFAPNTVSYDGGSSSVVLESPSPTVSAKGTVTLKPYTPPVATPQSVTVAYNVTPTITLTGTDSNGATLTYKLAGGTSAAGGMVSLSVNAVTYQPPMNYIGVDSFMFTVNDGVSTSAVATVSITVNPPLPVANPQTVNVNYETLTPILLTGSELGTQTLSFAVVSGPSFGSLSGIPPNVSYTPNATFSGTDSFMFTVTNAAGSGTAKVTLNVANAPATPVAQPASVTVAFNSSTSIMALAGGGNGTALVYSVVGAPAAGTGTVGSFGTSTPMGASIMYNSGNFVGTTTFTYSATDGTHTSNTATITITVTPPPPTAINQTVTTAFQTNVQVTLVATIVAGSPSPTYSIVSGPTTGNLSSLTGTGNNTVTYMPASNFVGTDTFTFVANDGANSAPATVTIVVSPPPLPTISNLSVTTVNGGSASILLTATGLGTLTLAAPLKTAQGGTLTPLAASGGTVMYTAPSPPFSGTDSFTYTATNPGGTSTGTVTITVLPAPGIAQGQSVTTAYGVSVVITLNATGTGPFTYSIVQPPSVGTLSAVAGSQVTYTPPAGSSGTTSFTFKANNGSDSNAATVSITINPPALVWSLASGSPGSVTVHAGQAATYSLLLTGYVGSSGPVNFTCTGAAISCTVSPNPGTLNGTNPIPVTVSISTTTLPPSSAGFGQLGWCFLLTLGGCLLLLRPLRKRKPLLLCAITLLAMVGFSGCGTVPEHPFGTANGTYVFTVTATAGTATASETLTIIVD
jgi:hypothetical protein